MLADVISAIVAFILGAAVSSLNYVLARFVLKNSPDKFVYVTGLRQIVAILFLVIVYVISDMLPISTVWVLCGAVLGITIPMFYFTKKLLEINREQSKKKREEADNNG